MSTINIHATLSHLRSLTAENEIVEFKEAKNTYDFNKLGKYFSALSNEANLKGKPYAWLVFGIENKNHAVVGTQYRLQRKDLDSLKSEIALVKELGYRLIFNWLHLIGKTLLKGKNKKEHF